MFTRCVLLIINERSVYGDRLSCSDCTMSTEHEMYFVHFVVLYVYEVQNGNGKERGFKSDIRRLSIINGTRQKDYYIVQAAVKGYHDAVRLTWQRAHIGTLLGQ
jgi:hypothetical protein